MRADHGLDHNENYFLDFLRLSIVIWPHATSSSIETVCAKWRILAYITIILNMDMAMPKRQVTQSIGCTSFSNVNMQIYGCRLSSQGCVPVKWTAPEVLFGDIAKLSSKSDVYVLLYAPIKSKLQHLAPPPPPPQREKPGHLNF